MNKILTRFLGCNAKHKVYWIDETGLNTKMIRRYGRSQKGARCVGFAPYGHWHTTTFVATLSDDGIHAPMVVDGAMTGDVFRAYVEQCLIPILNPGDLVIADNLSAHKSKGVWRIIQEKGAKLLFQPPYSPDFDPIEKAFSKLKGLLEKAALRTKDALWEGVGKLLDCITKEDCKGYIRSCGYVVDGL